MNRKINQQGLPKKNAVGFWVTLMLILIIELLVSVWCRVQCTRTGYEINAILQQQQQLIALRENLKIECARLRSPERIMKIAGEKLGLVMPESDQMVILE